jgi:hypothetical protein
MNVFWFTFHALKPIRPRTLNIEKNLEWPKLVANDSLCSAWISKRLLCTPIENACCQQIVFSSLWTGTSQPILWNKFKNLTWFTAELYVYTVVFQRRKTCFIFYTHLLFIFYKGLYVIHFLWQQEKQIMVNVFYILPVWVRLLR